MPKTLARRTAAASDPIPAPPTPDDVRSAAALLRGRVVATPVLRCAELDALAGARLCFKAENLQHGGSYKLRGATLALLGHARRTPGRPVVAQSTGNHAIAVALAARGLGIEATVVLPMDAPTVKQQRARAAGAHVLLAGTTLAERLARVEEVRAATGAAVVDAYDHPDVIAGQGTATLELVEETAAGGVHLDAVVIPVGGGGGIAGACLAVAAAGAHRTAVVGVEPVGCDSLARSLRAGARVGVEPAATIADGLRPALVGRLPFEIARHRVEDVLTVDDEAIATALCLLLLQARLLVEPSAAAALAGAFELARRRPGTDIGVVLTGGTVDPLVLAGLLARHLAAGSAR